MPKASPFTLEAISVSEGITTFELVQKHRGVFQMVKATVNFGALSPYRVAR